MGALRRRAVSAGQDEEAWVCGGEWHSRPGNSMCVGSEPGKGHTRKKGRKAESAVHDPRSRLRWGWVMQVLAGAAFDLQARGSH